MIEKLKQYLNISWEDNELDKKLINLLEQSKNALTSLMGVSINFEEDKELEELLFNRVRYSYNNSLEYFEENFKSEILRLQLQKGVEALEIKNSNNE